MELNKIIKVSTFAELQKLEINSKDSYYIEDSKLLVNGKLLLEIRQYEQSKEFKEYKKWYGIE